MAAAAAASAAPAVVVQFKVANVVCGGGGGKVSVWEVVLGSCGSIVNDSLMERPVMADAKRRAMTLKAWCSDSAVLD